MSENKNPDNNIRNDEIDLMDLFRRIGRTFNGWVKSIGRAFLIMIVFLLKRWLPLGLSIISGFGISFALELSSSSFYYSDLVFRNNMAKEFSGTTEEFISHVNTLHKFCMENNQEALSEVLSLKQGYINNILDISAFWIIDKNRDGIPDLVDYKNDHYIYDTINIRMQDRVNIRVKTKSPQELSLLRDGLQKFIDNDSLFQQKNRLRLKQNLEMIRRLEYDIIQLDSLQKIKYFVETKYTKPQDGGQMIFLQEQKTQLIYADIHALYVKKQNLESIQELYKGITKILSDFVESKKRDNDIFYYAIVAVPLCFVIVLLILIILANRKKLREVYNKY